MRASHPPRALINAKLLLGRDATPAAIGFRDGRILTLGSETRVREALGPRAEVFDAEGAVLSPGFIDSHMHLSSLGENLTALDLANCPSIAELKRRLSQRAEGQRQGSWITGRGWDQDRMQERRYPTAADLDEAAPGFPVVLRRACGHAAVASTLALRAAGVDDYAEDPPGGRYEREGDGKITGLLHETAMKRVLSAIPKPDRETRNEYLRRGIEKCHSVGITSVQTNESGADLDELYGLFSEIFTEPKRRLRAYLDLGPTHLSAIRDLGLSTGDGDEFLRLGALKLFADGSLGARTALLSRDYRDDPGNRGTDVIPEEEMREYMEWARSLEMQVAVHAIGDAALDNTLRLLGKSGDSTKRDRIIHCQITRPEQFGAMARAGIIASIQPRFVATDMAWAEARIGRELISTSYAWRSMLDAGVTLAGGSDAPVEPPDPLLGIHAAVNRVDDAGEPPGGWFAAEQLAPREALHLFGPGAAKSEGAEDWKGSLEPGFVADFVLLDADPLEVDPGEIAQIEVLETWVGGIRVYGESSSHGE
ncbi:MAG: amidohydrolase [Bacillota bacterium]